MLKINYKSVLCVLLVLGFTVSQAFAYRFDPIYFQKKDFTFGASIGLLPTFASPYVHAKGVPVTFVAEYRFAEKFSIGANVAFAGTHFQSDLPEHAVIPREITSRQFQANVRLGIHHSINRTDFYGGLMLGFSHEKNETDLKKYIDEETPRLVQDNNKDSRFLYSAYIGVQQQVTDRLGIYAEAGYSTTILQFGVCYKISSKTVEKSKGELSLKDKQSVAKKSTAPRHCPGPCGKKK